MGGRNTFMFTFEFHVNHSSEDGNKTSIPFGVKIHE